MVVPPITLLVGTESALRDEAVGQIRDALFKDTSSRDLNSHLFTAGQDALSEILMLAGTAPFLASRRLVILKEVENLEDAEKKELLAFLAHEPKFACWVLMTDETSTTKSAFLGGLGRLAKVVNCQAPYRDSEFKAWIRKRVTEEGKTIAEDAADLLIQRTGRDLSQIGSRIEQLCIYASGRKGILLKDVEDLCGESAEESAFNLYEALERGDFETAFKGLSKLLEEGAKPHEVIGAMVWRFERNARIKNLLDQGETPADIGYALRINRFFLEREIGQARRLNAGKFGRQLSALSECDQSIKRGLSEPAAALEKCFLALNQAQPS